MYILVDAATGRHQIGPAYDTIKKAATEWEPGQSIRRKDPKGVLPLTNGELNEALIVVLGRRK